MGNRETVRATPTAPELHMGGILRRKCASCGQHTVAGSGCSECDMKKSALRRKTSTGEALNGVPPIVHEVLRSPGQPLDPATRAFMEPRFGHDFSRVRLHSDARAAESTNAVNALAYTVGHDVVFGAGRYDPATMPGRRILAHELMHVVQQDGLASSSQKMEIGPSDDSFEREADAMAIQVSSGSGPASNNPLHRGVQRSGGGGLQRARLQRSNGDGHDLSAPRFAGDPVLEACFDDKRLLQVGDEGDAVGKIQQALVDAGFQLPKYGIDLKFGPETKAAVKSFQRQAGLTGSDVDGIVGPITMGLLDTQFSTAPPEPSQSAAEVPTEEVVTTKTKGEIGTKEPELEQKPIAKETVKVMPTSAADAESLFTVTMEFDVKNDWFLKPLRPAPPTSFLCEHGAFIVGGKLNVGIKMGKSGRFEALTEPELDFNLMPGYCGANTGVTAQLNLFKFKIVRDILETDLVGIFGLPDGWAKGLPNFPFTGGFQGKAQWTPFGAGKSRFKKLKIGVYGSFMYQQGVEELRPGWGVGGGVFLGHDFDFVPAKRPARDRPSKK